jgi:general secretion pathway protein D
LTAIKDDDLLKIVNLSEAILHKLPVYLMDSPEDIPNNETWATWVIPLNFIQANGMVGDLGEFVPDFANIMVNDSGNSLVITDAQTRTRKIAEIVWLLEGAVIDSTVSEFFKINYAYAEDVSLLIQDLFGGGTSQNRNRNRQNNRNSSNNQGQVSAVADYRTNTLIISAPFEIMENIREVIDQVDEPVEETSIIKYFPLRYAGAEETASLILSLFNTTQNNTGFGFDIQFGGSSNNYSERSVRDEQVYALADTRVNAVIVKAAESIMPEIEATINSLDSDSSGDQKIFVYDVGAWSVEEVAEMLNQIFSGNGQGGSTARATGQTNRQRQTSGQRGGGIGR